VNRRYGNRIRMSETRRDSMIIQHTLQQMTPTQRRQYELRQWRNMALYIIITLSFFLACAALFYFVRS
jgi:hypothetical protein